LNKIFDFYLIKYIKYTVPARRDREGILSAHMPEREVMKNQYVKYEKLSTEIKHEITEYHKSIMQSKTGVTFDESMNQWFGLKFDEWLIRNYGMSDKMSGRKHFRMNIEIPIRVIETLIESSSDDTNALDFVGKIINISRGGLYFRYGRPIEVSSIIKVIIDFNNVDKELSEVEALAMVVRTEKVNEEYGIGIMFSSIYGDNKELLDTFILKNLSYYIYSENLPSDR